MPRILLTQSQVSVFASSAVVITFTFLLFLSGYIIQQQTVRGLQAAIKPRIPQRPAQSLPPLNNPPAPTLQPSRLFRRQSTDGAAAAHVAFTDFDFRAHHAADTVDWTRRAHVQLVRTHRDVCNAVMLLAELHRQKSPARRVLLFPAAWAAEPAHKLKRAGSAELSDPFFESTRRLMRLAARRYGVELRPVSPIATAAVTAPAAAGKGGAAAGKRGAKEDVVVGEGDGEIYSLASAFALQAEFDRVLAVETPGLVLDAEPLDALLGFTESAPLAMLQDAEEGDGVHADDLFLLEPSAATFDGLVERFREAGVEGLNDTSLPSMFQDPLLLAPGSEDSALVRSVSVLHDVDSSFNRTAFLSDVSYVRLSDPKLPGPEYDIPWSQKLDARPKNKDADWVWTSLYGEFAQKRMEICGLDLESWRP